ncbi:MAG: 5'-3' exonuclease H3TH domain-containing protein, partial [Desulfobacterales bacterium]|nr:5'-3' exonuclease H3TH domain-containing protein [Desulfobacterales bacterium]
MLDAAGVGEKFGVRPAQIADYLALVGDTSDNIPGVKGVGEKTATQLIAAYGSLDGVYEHIDEVKQTRFRQALEAGHADALMSQHLVT